MNGSLPEQTCFDLRTGRETTLQGAVFGATERSACSALNRRRAKGIQEATRDSSSRQSFTADAWAALVAERAREWNVPLVNLKELGLRRDEDGMIVSNVLAPLKTGAEASPFADFAGGVVYKLFPLHINGGLGKTFEIERDVESEGIVMSVRDAVLHETIEKLSVMHEAGAHPTELVGIDDQGEYLIAKQPLAEPYGDFENLRDLTIALIDRMRPEAVARMRAVPCRSSFKRPVWVLWCENRPWIMSDLHPGNVMKDAGGKPCIIDALLSPLPSQLIRVDRLIFEAVEDARIWRETGTLPQRKAFEDVNDDDL